MLGLAAHTIVHERIDCGDVSRAYSNSKCIIIMIIISKVGVHHKVNDGEVRLTIDKQRAEK